MTDKGKFLKAKEVSKSLGIPVRTIHRLSKQGRIKSIKIGGRWLYPKNEIDKYLSVCPDFSTLPNIRSLEPSEKRENPRINCFVNCAYSVDIPGKNRVLKGIIRNISAGGVLITDAYGDISIDDPLNMEFTLPINNNQKIIKTKGRIIRKAGDGFGVKFRNIEKHYQDLIIKHIG